MYEPPAKKGRAAVGTVSVVVPKYETEDKTIVSPSQDQKPAHSDTISKIYDPNNQESSSSISDMTINGNITFQYLPEIFLSIL